MAETPSEKLNRHLYVLEHPDEERWSLEATGALECISYGVERGTFSEREHMAEFARLREILRGLRPWILADAERRRALEVYRTTAKFGRSHWWWYPERL